MISLCGVYSSSSSSSSGSSSIALTSDNNMTWIERYLRKKTRFGLICKYVFVVEKDRLTIALALIFLNILLRK